MVRVDSQELEAEVHRKILKMWEQSGQLLLLRYINTAQTVGTERVHTINITQNITSPMC